MSKGVDIRTIYALYTPLLSVSLTHSLFSPRCLHFIGGLTVENVGEAAVTSGVMGVDVSSGVEIKGRPGVKDLEALKGFILNARK
jgi:phosphoribosylanthranilate isomerase